MALAQSSWSPQEEAVLNLVYYSVTDTKTMRQHNEFVMPVGEAWWAFVGCYLRNLQRKGLLTGEFRKDFLQGVETQLGLKGWVKAQVEDVSCRSKHAWQEGRGPGSRDRQ